MGQESLTDAVLSVNFSTIHSSGLLSHCLHRLDPLWLFSGAHGCLHQNACTFHNNSKGYNNKPLECRLHSCYRAKPSAGYWTGWPTSPAVCLQLGVARHGLLTSCGSTWSIIGKFMTGHRESTNAPFNTEAVPCGPGQVTCTRGDQVPVTQGTT